MVESADRLTASGVLVSGVSVLSPEIVTVWESGQLLYSACCHAFDELYFIAGDETVDLNL